MREDIDYMKKELKEQSLAMCLLQDMKLVNKRLYNTLIIVLLLWVATVVGFVYYINNYTVSKTLEYIETDSDSGLQMNECWQNTYFLL